MKTPELLRDIFTASKDRVKNPIISSFAISWILFNWKLVSTYLFSNEDIKTKIEIISTDYTKSKFLFWFPLASALFFTILMPYLRLCIDWLLMLGNNIRLDRERKSEEDRRQHEKKIATIEFEIEEEKTGKKTIEELNITIQDQKKNLESYEQDFKRMMSDLEEKDSKILELDEVIVKIDTNLKTINDNHKKLSAERSKLKEKLSESEIDIGDLHAREFKLKQEVNSKKEEIESLHKSMSKAEKHVLELDKLINDFDLKHTKQKTKIQELEKINKDVISQLNALKVDSGDINLYKDSAKELYKDIPEFITKNSQSDVHGIVRILSIARKDKPIPLTDETHDRMLKMESIDLIEKPISKELPLSSHDEVNIVLTPKGELFDDISDLIIDSIPKKGR